jgi:hypothetical protein
LEEILEIILNVQSRKHRPWEEVTCLGPQSKVRTDQSSSLFLQGSETAQLQTKYGVKKTAKKLETAAMCAQVIFLLVLV